MDKKEQMATGRLIALIQAYAPAADPETITAAVQDWLDDHPEATTTVEDGSITMDKLASALAAKITGAEDDISDLKSANSAMSTATASDVGKALSPKTVANGKVTEWQFKNIGGGGGGGAVDDVQLNGTSIVDGDGVANITPGSLDFVSNVSGTTPSITGSAGMRYVCGECSTLSITAPASGCIDVTFTSGSTPTVMTVTSAKANTTIKWANGFDPTSLEANTTYEINILDGEFGVVGSWT